MARETQGLRKLIKVTAWRSGCVYSTAEIGEVWIPLGSTPAQEHAIAQAHGADMLGSIGTKEAAGRNLIRTVEV